MILMILMSMMILAIIFILILLLNLISKKTFYDREKSSPFECGFDPKSNARLPFSLHFFLIAMIFLIFDVEITLLLPLILTLKLSNILNYSIVMMLFIIILILGLYHEWNQGALNWTN
uniref:NADH-ubiquinone oxidoreductase chain 3 n=1 Tax=Argopistes tsekooni TaxID=2016140 RepID=A0A6C0PT71_9CUCU|nr:NADH dehydrogenase subunit 3 [Argopistes tsekooni]QHX99904.1 NADH dehydrogenase subunit 3 [Argopistes tsekooni]